MSQEILVLLKSSDEQALASWYLAFLISSVLVLGYYFRFSHIYNFCASYTATTVQPD